ncbi:hypothetical protein A2454_02420 [Candidatus Peribacteria bacterium RIFOXYC2_FULL_55_14]|nr:MAG: hypothetical protein UY85_C0002G0006 [Candidatus Peribacteria bacterium GW2011_GWB1_54_5]KKW41116.1 MAG: hypothetical protein UY87_C0004G0026 [Candidatus Peribacteria bacterium GW2011_GWC2_54_8]KKW42186.1 MAG: hypothetical protein UY90_C0040G0007 [Candidatus Peregrinibacteria bacterium GW2011_GWA2_54_9]OGJ71292.1 MAG: hypothetical protein A2198_05820 [Candidatus Peribacteria bacterium RIFOXYA1_FULL_56_14]OGJ74365.1 MAG: hypothetical protein A2384_06585 [Candidatus Peribacteria bacterium
MAHHREVSIAVCGIVVGTMLGAGSLILGRDVTASVGDEDAQFTTYRQGIIFDNQYRKRAISEEDRRTRPRAEVQQFNESEAAPDVGQGTVVDTEECRQRVRYAEEIRAFVIPLIPGRAIDQLVRSSMQDAFDNYIADCLPYVEEEAQESEADADIEVQPNVLFDSDDEYCYQYTGSRRSRCIVEQRENATRYQDHR